MVIEKILKVNSNDPKVDELRKRLQALQAKPAAPSQPASAPAPAGTPPPADKKEPPKAVASPSTGSAPKDDMSKLQELSFQEQKRLMERNNPELRLKEERTNHLIMNQIKELITLNNEATKRIKDAETKQADLAKQLEMFREKNEETIQKMNSIDSRLEKFMGLYELITNQYNPFTDGQLPPSILPAAAKPQPPRPGPPPAAPAHAPAAAPSQPPAPSGEKPASDSAGPAQTFHVEDNLTKQTAAVEVKAEDMQTAEAQFKRVEEMLAGLQKKNEQVSQVQPAAEPPKEVTSELHALLAGFEQRLQQRFDASLQQKLHTGFSALEANLQAELRDALRAEIEKAQADDEEVQQALRELQELTQAAETSERQPVDDEFATLTRELEQMRKEFQQLPSHLFFQLTDGKQLTSLGDLKQALGSMPAEVFSEHVSGERNDFASWVEHALQQPDLAAKMRAAKSPQELLAALTAA